MDFAASFSGGKDSFLSIIEMINKGHRLRYLLVSSTTEGLSYTHNLDKEYFIKASKILGCDVIFTDTTIENYEKSFEEALIKIRKNGVKVCVFGDIDISEHIKWNNDRCEKAGVKCINPLSRYSRNEIIKKFFSLNIDAIIKKVNQANISERFVGKKLSLDLIEEMKKEYKGDIFDICGENGEYHTYIDLDNIEKYYNNIERYQY